jgi:RNA recognition motif-containing protein
MTIYIKNIHVNTTERKLSKLFKKYGKVNSVLMAMEHKLGMEIAYGYVEMENHHEAEKAISILNGATYKRQKISVSPATILKNTNTYYEI